MCATEAGGPGRRRRPAPAARGPARRTCAGRRSAARGRRRRSAPGPAGASRRRRVAAADQQLSAHAQVAHQREVAAVEREPEVLAPPAGRRHPAPGEPALEVGRPGRVPAHGARVQHLGVEHGAPGHPAVEPAPHHLDLGQLGHQASAGSAASVAGGSERGRGSARAARRTPWPRPPARPPSCCARAPSPNSVAADADPRRERLLVVRPALLDDVLRHARARRRRIAPAGGLPVEPGPERRRPRRSARRRAGGPARWPPPSPRSR